MKARLILYFFAAATALISSQGPLNAQDYSDTEIDQSPVAPRPHWCDEDLGRLLIGTHGLSMEVTSEQTAAIIRELNELSKTGAASLPEPPIMGSPGFVTKPSPDKPSEPSRPIGSPGFETDPGSGGDSSLPSTRIDAPRSQIGEFLFGPDTSAIDFYDSFPDPDYKGVCKDKSTPGSDTDICNAYCLQCASSNEIFDGVGLMDAMKDLFELGQIAGIIGPERWNAIKGGVLEPLMKLFLVGFLDNHHSNSNVGTNQSLVERLKNTSLADLLKEAKGKNDLFDGIMKIGPGIQQGLGGLSCAVNAIGALMELHGIAKGGEPSAGYYDIPIYERVAKLACRLNDAVSGCMDAIPGFGQYVRAAVPGLTGPQLAASIGCFVQETTATVWRCSAFRNACIAIVEAAKPIDKPDCDTHRDGTVVCQRKCCMCYDLETGEPSSGVYGGEAMCEGNQLSIKNGKKCGAVTVQGTSCTLEKVTYDECGRRKCTPNRLIPVLGNKVIRPPSKPVHCDSWN